ncbi:c-type cytochrome [Magnetospirillum aberrantis]|uniref:Cytochrome c n=1 Tax=Magnetospirillum aberrantis SpK TaxID=908842 RepID=A0A7C9UUN1_9PROT|nr:cytochrome c [Magnetospirillum aberrantis]NFV81007.1 cytochrome c [Magnetospirillum aberrantis SpK]
MTANRLILSLSTLAILAQTTFAIAAGDSIQEAQQLVNDLCATCHSVDGVSADDAFPNLAGQKHGYLVKQLTDFRSKARDNETMGPIAETLDDRMIDALATYYSSLPAGK